MKLTARTDYGLRVLMTLALLDDRLVTIEELARRHRLSKNHLMKVAQTLVGLGLVVSSLAVAVTLRRRAGSEASGVRSYLGAYLLLALTTGVVQGSTLFVLGGFEVGPALALFQTSALISVLLGWKVFREGHIARRLAGSVVMAGGAVLIILTR